MRTATPQPAGMQGAAVRRVRQPVKNALETRFSVSYFESVSRGSPKGGLATRLANVEQAID